MTKALSQPFAGKTLFTVYVVAIITIVAIYSIMVGGLLSADGPRNIKQTLGAFGFLFLLVFAPGTFSVCLCVTLAVIRQKPGPFTILIAVLSACWTVFALTALQEL